ncbi:TRAP transporter large permease subunit [Chloroflexota bacterium]
MLAAVVITGVICIFLGCGMPTVGAYIVVALMAAPVLHGMGLSQLQAHMYVFYWAILAGLTPPIAVAVIAGASIAGSKYLPTCIEAVRIGFAIFLVPFLFIYNPILLSEWSGQPPLSIITTVFASVLGIVPLAAASIGTYVIKLNPLERVALCLSGIGIWGYVISPNYLFLAAGIGIFIVVTLYQLKKGKIIWS